MDFWWCGEKPMLAGNADLATDGAVMTMHRRHSCVSARTDGTVPGIAGHFAKSIAIGSMAGVVGLLLAFAAIFIYVRKRPNPWLRSRNTREGHGHDFLEKYESLVPQRYKYRYLKKITKSFGEKLVQGGFGSVFKGQLEDSRLVAVKILSRSRKMGRSLVINEVASIGRTAHVNVVTLLGFCQEGKRRALVYEYMPNGSLERYIYSDPPETSLPWDKLYQIAIGIARGLEYLHQGCNTRIVHFDIKPHNILLDEDFCPKIADFGLAKLCPRKESILSMAEARGTIGYMAPEVFSRSFGAVSTKSDVYSYGTMVLEMVGGRKNIKARADARTSDACFPHSIYQYPDGGEDDLRVGDVTAETEEIPRKMMLVGLWCIQIAPPNRPSMSRVVEMLEASSPAKTPLLIVCHGKAFSSVTGHQLARLVLSAIINRGKSHGGGGFPSISSWGHSSVSH
ncbi:unnamed protein product [Musa acuminata var. zebrina]